MHDHTRPRLHDAGLPPTTKRRRARTSRRERGQSMVEFALIVPFFFVIFGGIITFGLALNNNMSVINAAREGARAGSMTENAANIPSAVTSRVNATASQSGLGAVTTTVTCGRGLGSTTTADPCLWSKHTATNTGGAQQGDYVTVKVDYLFPNPFPLSMKLGNTVVGLPTNFTLTSTVQMVLDAATSGS